MFQDEAGFGRINHPKYCWCEKGIRPSVPCHHIREYRYAYGAMELHGTNREHWKCFLGGKNLSRGSHKATPGGFRYF